MIHGFELINAQLIPELNTQAQLYRHAKTGAQLLSLENDDTNKVFGIGFKTPPEDSTGLPHIMEHSVLCGSRKYPVKEPFVELMKGSLNTFLNAFTYPDKTCYPVASQNLQDFYNLIDVYVDAVLYPLISPQTLQQEGWHFELDELEAPLKYKGVVFNEMKGAYSDPDNLLNKYVQEAVFPDNVYSVDSGGDPTVIPNLTYAQFKSFHERFYHPSNALVYFYGDDDPIERLQRMDGYLKEFETIQPASAIAPQPRFSEPRKVTRVFDAGEDSVANARKAMLTVNFLLEDGRQVQTSLGMAILSHILIGTPASPLRKALIDSGLGEDLAGVGLEANLAQQYFSTGLKGIKVEDAESVEALILQTLLDLVQQGIDPNTVAASMNSIEFALRENNTGRFPRGLALMLRALTTWLHGDDPCQRLAFEEPLQAIKRHLESGDLYFENLLERYFLKNPHRVTVFLKPETGYQQKLDEAERKRLEKIRSQMDHNALEEVIQSTAALKRAQETADSPAALATIPALELKDLDKENKHIPLEVLNLAGHKILYHNLFTNGIVYLDLGFNLHALPQELLPYTRLFGRALLEMGTATEDFVQLSQRIGRTTGGINPTSLVSAVYGADTSTTWFVLRGKATIDKAQGLVDILQDVLLTAQLDNPERFRQIVLEEKAEQEASLAPMGHMVVNRRLSAKFTEAAWVNEQLTGLSYLFFLRHLAELLEKDWPSVLTSLEQMRSLLINSRNMISNITLDAANWQLLQPRFDAFLSALPDRDVKTVLWQYQPARDNEGLTFPAQVNYVGKGGNLYQLGYALQGSAFVINKYLKATWLWERVRVHGGAYGGFSVFDPRSGVFNYLSYRDPNVLRTVANYDAASQFLSGLDESRLDSQELTKAIIGAIGEMDIYLLPDAQGLTSMMRYLVGETEEFLQQMRDEALATTLQDFHAFGEVLSCLSESGSVVVLGSQDAIQEANVEHDNWLQVQKVL